MVLNMFGFLLSCVGMVAIIVAFPLIVNTGGTAAGVLVVFLLLLPDALSLCITGQALRAEKRYSCSSNGCPSGSKKNVMRFPV